MLQLNNFVHLEIVIFVTWHCFLLMKNNPHDIHILRIKYLALWHVSCYEKDQVLSLGEMKRAQWTLANLNSNWILVLTLVTHDMYGPDPILCLHGFNLHGASRLFYSTRAEHFRIVDIEKLMPDLLFLLISRLL